MNEQFASNIGNQFGKENIQNFNSTFNLNNFVDEHTRKFECVKNEISRLNYDDQHQIYAQYCDLDRGIFCLEGEREYGHRLITRYLLYSHFFKEKEDKEIHFITNSHNNPDIIVNTCETLSLPDNDINSVLKQTLDWLQIKKVAIIFEDFMPNDFYENICIPFIDFFEHQNTNTLKRLHLFWLNSAFLNQNLEVLLDRDKHQIKQFEIIKLPKLSNISYEHVIKWYKSNSRNLSKYESTWLKNICSQNEDIFIKETAEKPQRVIRKIVDSFGLKYQIFINQLCKI